ERGDVNLERPPHVEQVEQRTRVAADGDLEEVPEESSVGRRDRRPPPLRDLEQPARLQGAGGLPDREPAHAERLRELSLRRQGLARLEAAKDQPLELLDHRVQDGRPIDRRELVHPARPISHVWTACLISRSESSAKTTSLPS